MEKFPFAAEGLYCSECFHSGQIPSLTVYDDNSRFFLAHTSWGKIIHKECASIKCRNRSYKVVRAYSSRGETRNALHGD